MSDGIFFSFIMFLPNMQLCSTWSITVFPDCDIWSEVHTEGLQMDSQSGSKQERMTSCSQTGSILGGDGPQTVPDQTLSLTHTHTDLI